MDPTAGNVRKEFVQGLRAAETVIARIEEGKTSLTMSKKVKVSGTGGLTPKNERIEVSAEYNGFPGVLPSEYKSACFVTLYKTGAWQALGLILRPSDSLYFRATDNRNGYLEVAEIKPESFGAESRYHAYYKGLHNDTLFVNVNRNGKQIIGDLELESSTCPDNSARALVR